MKKVILWVAIILVALIPTYILIFQAIKTAAPEVNLGDDPAEPAYVQWVVMDSEGNQRFTSRSEKSLRRQFEESEPTVLTSLDELKSISFSKEPETARVFLYDLSGQELPAETVTLAELQAGTVAPRTAKTQAILTVEWVISESIRVRAVFSFEVHPL